MALTITGHSIALWASAAVSLVTAAAAWRKRTVPAVVPFFLMMCGVFVWGVMSGFQSAAVGLDGKILFAQLTYVGVSSVAPLFLAFALAYGGGVRTLHPAAWGLISVVPIATLVIAFTNRAHGLLWPGFTPDPRAWANIVYFSHGTWYWVSVVYSAVLSAAATVLVVRSAIRAPRIYARQTGLMVAGVAVAWLAQGLYASPLNPIPGLDLVPIGFAVTGIFVLLGISSYGLFSIVPIARSTLVERMVDGLVVLDSTGRLIDLNPAARRMLGVEDPSVGKPAVSVLPALAGALPQPGKGPEDSVSELWLPGPAARHYELTISSLQDRRGCVGGHLVVLHDITDRTALIADLEAALSDARTLRGLLPVCSSCRRIRNDAGAWEQMESYVSRHTNAQFSHGLCEDCARKLYPDLPEPR